MSILYTPVPQEAILMQAWGESPELVEVEIGDNKRILVSPIDQRRGRVVRLLSTDPDDYLDYRWEPGSIVPLP